MTHRIRTLGVAQMAKVLGALYFLLGVVFALIFGVVGSMVPSAETGADVAMFGTGFIIAMPFLYAILGFVFGALIAWLYNVVAGFTGGIEIELDSVAP